MPSQLSISAYTLNNRLYEGIAKNAAASDEYLLKQAMVKAEKKTKKSKAAKAYKALPLLTSAGLVGYSALTKQGPLSAKVAAGAAMAGLFAGIDLGFKAYRKIRNNIQEKRGDEEKKPSKHPTAKAIFGIIGTLAAVTAGYFGIVKGATAFAKTDLGTRVIGHLRNFGEKIDSSKFAKKINAGAIDSFFVKHPSAKTALFWTPIAGSLIGHGALSAKLDQKFNEEVEENFEEYLEEREGYRAVEGAFKKLGIQGQPAEKDSRGHIATIEDIRAFMTTRETEVEL